MNPTNCSNIPQIFTAPPSPIPLSKIKLISAIALTIILLSGGIFAILSAHAIDSAAFYYGIKAAGGMACIGASLALMVALIEARRVNLLAHRNPVINCIHSSQKTPIIEIETIEFINVKVFLDYYASVLCMSPKSVKGNHSSNPEEIFHQTRLTVELSDPDREIEILFNEDLILQALKMRFPDFIQANALSSIYLSKESLQTIFTPLIPDSPMLGWAKKAGLCGVLLALPDLIGWILINLGIQFAIIIEHCHNPVEAELLRVRASLNYYAPTQTIANAIYKSL